MEIVKRKVGNLPKFIGISLLLLTALLAYAKLNSKSDFINFQKTSTEVGAASNSPETEQLSVELDYKSYEKIRAKKWDAYNYGILFSKDEDLVPVVLHYQGKSYPAEIRLKGDWLEHLKKETWSFRVKMKDNHTLRGMRKFSLQHPQTRNYAGEWLFHQTLKAEDILSLKYDFLNVTLKIQEGGKIKEKNLGYYALEEFFDKQLMESNGRREGVLLKLDEDPFWQEKSAVMKKELKVEEWKFAEIIEFDKLNILPFGENHIQKDATLTGQFHLGRALLSSFIQGEKPASEVYDIDKLSTYNALCNLLGANHSMVLHNFRVYYNPISGLLEPVGFDGNSTARSNWFPAFANTENDMVYTRKYIEALERISQDEYVEQLLNHPGLAAVVKNLEATYPDYNWDPEVILYHKKIIQTALQPANFLAVMHIEQGEDYMRLNIENFHRFPAEIQNIQMTSGKILGQPSEPIIIAPNSRMTVDFKINKNFERIFVSKKKRKTSFNPVKDLSNLRLSANVIGASTSRLSTIYPWGAKLDLLDNLPRSNDVKSLKRHAFLDVDEENKLIICQPGNHVIPDGFFIPKGYTFIITAGTQFDFSQFNRYIISYSPVHFIGSKERPIRFFSSTSKGNGILVLNAERESILKYVEFDNLDYPKNGFWAVSGAVNFYKSPVKISHCSFNNMRSEDALNIINTTFHMEDVLFKNNKSDAFDGDFVSGQIDNCLFTDQGNDGIDISGSQISVSGTSIFNAGDKALSAGEKSSIIADHLIIKNSEIAVASKDQSTIQLNNSLVTENKLGFTAYQKKSEFGPGHITADSITLNDNNTLHLIEKASSLQLNGKAAEQVNQVIDRMYGKEFGKKSGE